MFQLPYGWMLRLLETIDWGVDTARSCNCHCLCVWFPTVGCVLSGFVMLGRASGLGMGVGRLSRPQRGVGVPAMLDGWLDTTRYVESACQVPQGAGVLRLLAPGMAVGIIIDRHCVADGITVTRWVISAKPELFSDDEGVESWPWVVEGTEVPPWVESLSPAGTETRLLPAGSSEFPEGPPLYQFWHFSKISNISYDWSRIRMRSLGRHCPI